MAAMDRFVWGFRATRACVECNGSMRQCFRLQFSMTRQGTRRDPRQLSILSLDPEEMVGRISGRTFLTRASAA